MTTELVHFLSRYRRSGPTTEPHAPDLCDSLREFSRIHAELGALGRLSDRCRCLIQGYAAPDNARHLREYLTAVGVASVDILAVDLYDLPTIYAGMECEHPPMRFQLADARDLRSVVEDQSIDLVAQDFLVNCVHPFDVAAIFQETSRVLAPDGIAFVSFTDDQCMRNVEVIDPGMCDDLMDIRGHLLETEDPDASEQLLGRRFLIPGTGVWAFATLPHGRLEYFPSLNQTLSEIENAGLEVLAKSVSEGLDDHGLECVRHRCILRRSRRRMPE
jgi:SAM-dependent methyltransferase